MLAIYAFVKKKVVVLKIYAVLLLIWIFLQTLAIDPISALDEGCVKLVQAQELPIHL